MKTYGIIGRLTRADRAWRRSRALEALFRSVKIICAVAVLFVVIDLIAQLGSVIRFGFSALGGLVLGWFFILLLVRAIGGERTLLPIARHLEDRDDTLGTSLINTLQLQEQANDEELPKLTRALASEAVEDSAGSVEGRDFIPLAKSPTIGSSLRRALIPIGLVLVPALVWAPITWREVLRFVDPFGDHPPFSFTQLKIVSPSDDSAKVVYHRPITIEAEFAGHRPKEVFLSVDNADTGGETTLIPMFPRAERSFVQQIDHVDANLTVRAQTRSGRSRSQGRKVGVILTPQLETASVTVEAPAYARLEGREKKLALEKPTAPTLPVLNGSKLAFSLTSNRPLSEGSVRLDLDAEGPMAPLRPTVAEAPHQAQAMWTATESGRLRFDLRDVTGLPCDRELVANLVVTHDLPPEVAITEPAADGFVVENYTATVAVRSSDDYGLKQIRIHAGLNGNFGQPRIVEAQTDPPQRDSLQTIQLTPMEMGAVPGDVISVFAEATDIRPETQLARTRTLKLQVISEEAYNDFLRARTEIRDLERKYSTLHDELRELARQQRELAKKAEQAKNSADEETRDELAAEQSRLNANLIDLAEKMESTTRENPLYDIERELQKTLDAEAKKVRESVAQNQEVLESFLAAEPSDQSMGGFAQEAEEQAERLDPARESAEQQIASTLEDADKIQQLLKAIGAYQQLYEIQTQLASQTRAYQGERRLDHEDRISLQQMASTERGVGQGLERIIENLRQGAEKAKDAYPQAAQDALEIAEAIERANLTSLAENAAGSMLAARGSESLQRAEHLRQEMEKLMGQCSQCQGGMGESFALRLALMQMMAGNTFSQMAQNRNFGLGLGFGLGVGGAGMGLAGSFAMGRPVAGPNVSLLGGESMLGQNAREESAATSPGQADGSPSPGLALASGPTEGAGAGPSKLVRPADSALGGAVIAEYDDLVDAYFRRLTTRRTDSP